MSPDPPQASAQKAGGLWTYQDGTAVQVQPDAEIALLREEVKRLTHELQASSRICKCGVAGGYHNLDCVVYQATLERERERQAREAAEREVERLTREAEDRQHCASDPYWCPTAGEVESACHGGFDVCCEHPELHRPTVAVIHELAADVARLTREKEALATAVPIVEAAASLEERGRLLDDVARLTSERDAIGRELRDFLDGDRPYCNQHDMERWERVEAENAAMKAVVEKVGLVAAHERRRDDYSISSADWMAESERLEGELWATYAAFGARAGLNEGSER